QRLFRQLSVFDGGCTIDAVKNVCQLESDESVLDRLAVLVDHSLVRIDPLMGDEARCGMLQTIREFAVEWASAWPAELEQLQRRHAQYFADLATASPDRAANETRNLKGAQAWSMAAGDVELALRLSGALAPTWQHPADIAAARTNLDALLAIGAG